MPRYSIEAIQYGSINWAEVCRVETNPDQIVEALQNKRLRIKLPDGRWGSAEKYMRVRVVDMEPVSDD